MAANLTQQMYNELHGYVVQQETNGMSLDQIKNTLIAQNNGVTEAVWAAYIVKRNNPTNPFNFRGFGPSQPSPLGATPEGVQPSTGMGYNWKTAFGGRSSRSRKARRSNKRNTRMNKRR